MTKLKKSELDTDSSGPAHCQFCGERFMGEDRAEVVLKGRPEKDSLIVHATCFDPERMEIA